MPVTEKSRNICLEEKIRRLRELMKREGIGAFIFPSSDPHNGEYVPEHWHGREWISGFTGSAGTAVVTMHSAALWTDSRYFIQAAKELIGSEYILMREKLTETPSITEWLKRELADSKSKEVGIDGMVIAASDAEALIRELRAAGGLTLKTNLDPLEEIWEDRPAIPLNAIRVHPLEYAGESAKEKISRIRKELRKQHADGMLVTELDEIAWTLNIRGIDVNCTPVAVGYLLISSSSATLFTDSRKVSKEVSDYLLEEGVETEEYSNILDGLRRYPDYNILLDPNSVNYYIYNKVKTNIISGTSPIPAMKAIKNEAEKEGFRKAMFRDGIAMMKFVKWLKDGARKHREENKDEDSLLVIDSKVQTEMSICRKLYELRAEQEGFLDVSFETIAGYGEHGAIVHYEPTEESDIPLKAKGFLLLDSGAQYIYGTTDITRTIPLGPLTEEEKLVYTLVLKGHIDLQLLKFPDGACGTQLDVIARKALWEYGYNYLHGTGHGVGSCLSVHEGPHQIRMEYRSAPIHAGMTITDEPGIYLEELFGVRIENTLLTKKYTTPLEKAGRTLYPTPCFLEFETLTLCTIDTEPILWNLLTPEEKEWLETYNRLVEERLNPYL